MPQFNDVSWLIMSSKILFMVTMVILQISYTHFASYKKSFYYQKLSFLLLI